MGPLYGIYFVVCVAVIALVIAEFIVFGRSYRQQNRVSLYAIMLLVVAGFALASEHPDLSAEKLVHEADMAMYADKTAYYERTGLERRSH